MIASVIMLILAGNMYYYGNNNQYAIFIGIGGILILNAYSTGNKKKNSVLCLWNILAKIGLITNPKTLLPDSYVFYIHLEDH